MMNPSASRWLGHDGTLRLLLPIDGSRRGLAAVREAIALGAALRHPPHLVLLNVQPPVRGNIGRFISEPDLRKYHEDEGKRALRPTLKRVSASSMPHESHVVVGDVAESILDAATRYDCQAILLASRGHGTVSAALLGSIASRLLQQVKHPVILIRA